jgi:hypothetical protein
MYTKDDPVTWEIHDLFQPQGWWPRAREDRSPKLGGRGSRRAA